MKRRTKLILIFLFIGIGSGMIFFLGFKPILISQTEAISIVSKADGCERHSMQFVSAESNLYHLMNGGYYRVVHSSVGINDWYAGSNPNKFAFGYEWQVVLTCQGSDSQPEIIDWADAFTGQLIY